MRLRRNLWDLSSILWDWGVFCESGGILLLQNRVHKTEKLKTTQLLKKECAIKNTYFYQTHNLLVYAYISIKHIFLLNTNSSVPPTRFCYLIICCTNISGVVCICYSYTFLLSNNLLHKYFWCIHTFFWYNTNVSAAHMFQVNTLVSGKHAFVAKHKCLSYTNVSGKHVFLAKHKCLSYTDVSSKHVFVV
jgi:hypothetical protein